MDGYSTERFCTTAVPLPSRRGTQFERTRTMNSAVDRIRIRVATRLASVRLWRETQGSIFVEYLLLLTIVGIGVIAGLATVRGALISELLDLANAIASIT